MRRFAKRLVKPTITFRLTIAKVISTPNIIPAQKSRHLCFFTVSAFCGAGLAFLTAVPAESLLTLPLSR